MSSILDLCSQENRQVIWYSYFKYDVLEQMNHLEEQREHLQMQTDQAFRSADEIIEKICDEIWHHANTIHLYSSLAEEESKSITMKEKQKEIIRTTEEILNIIYKYKGNV